MSKFGLSQRIINELAAYFASKPLIDKVIIFGSRAKGNFHNGSDIDLAVWTDEHDSVFKIAGELDDLDTPYKFDVVDYKTLTHEGMKKNIDTDGILFYMKGEN